MGQGPPFIGGIPLGRPGPQEDPRMMRFILLVLDEDANLLDQILLNTDVQPQLGWSMDLVLRGQTEPSRYTVVDINMDIWANPEGPPPSPRRLLTVIVQPTLGPVVGVDPEGTAGPERGS
jgi:hypothetical protein